MDSSQNFTGNLCVNENLNANESLVKSDCRVNVDSGSLGEYKKDGSKPWVSLFADNQIKERGSELKFISPSVFNGQRVV